MQVTIDGTTVEVEPGTTVLLATPAPPPSSPSAPKPTLTEPLAPQSAVALSTVSVGVENS